MILTLFCVVFYGIVDRFNPKFYFMAKNINKKPFDDATKLKLEIFGESFREWLPVFINDRYTDLVYIFDFFAGSGTDSIGQIGSPLILLQEARGRNKSYCNTAKKEIEFVFNESLTEKYKELEENVTTYLERCKKEHKCKDCVYKYQIIQADFQQLFYEHDLQKVLKDTKIGKFILLDQYGFKQISESIFMDLIQYPKTDFIFFISSSFIKRFQTHEYTKQYIDTARINFDEAKPNECHRVIADYFKSIIPSGKEYYIHNFTIRKEKNRGNYYGLIFGSNHSLGMEKFIKVCWKKDPFSGEANFNIDNNYEPGSLFYNPETTNKKEKIKKLIKDEILNGNIKDNRTGLKYAMLNGCEPKLFTDVVKELEGKKIIKRKGEVNNSSSKIHKVKRYFITLAKKSNE